MQDVDKSDILRGFETLPLAECKQILIRATTIYQKRVKAKQDRDQREHDATVAVCKHFFVRTWIGRNSYVFRCKDCGYSYKQDSSG